MEKLKLSPTAAIALLDEQAAAAVIDDPQWWGPLNPAGYVELADVKGVLSRLVDQWGWGGEPELRPADEVWGSGAGLYRATVGPNKVLHGQERTWLQQLLSAQVGHIISDELDAHGIWVAQGNSRNEVETLARLHAEDDSEPVPVAFEGGISSIGWTELRHAAHSASDEYRSHYHSRDCFGTPEWERIARGAALLERPDLLAAVVGIPAILRDDVASSSPIVLLCLNRSALTVGYPASR